MRIAALLVDRLHPAALYAVRTAPECRLIDSERGLIRLVPAPVKIKLVYNARRHRLMMLAEIEEKAIRSSGKNMDDGTGITFLHRSHMIGNLVGERGRRAPRP